MGPLNGNGPLPLEDLPSCFQGRFASTLASCSRKRRTLFLSAGEKRFGVVLSQVLGPEPGDKIGGPQAQAKAEAHAKVCSCPLHIQKPRLSQRWSGSSLAAPAAPHGWIETADLGAPWACCSPCCPVDAGPKRAWTSTPFFPSSLCQRPRPLCCCSAGTAPVSISPTNRPQLRPRPRGKALAGLSL